MHWIGVVVSAGLLAGCVKKPEWIDACGCEEGELCSDGECMALPASCEDAFSDVCDLGDLEFDCVEDVCGWYGSYNDAECFESGKKTYFRLDCEES